MYSQIQDIVHAARTLGTSRAFTAVCVASLGVGMSVVIGVMLFARFMLGTPPLVQDQGLVEVVMRPQGALRAQAGGAILDSWSFADYLDMRDAASGMTITAWARGEGLLREERGARPVATLFVSSNYFSNIGVTLARGPGFTPVDDASRAEAEAVISHRTWQRSLNSDPNIIGRTIVVNQTPYTVVGVTPEMFRSLHSGDESSHHLWLPLSHHRRLAAVENGRFDRDAYWLRVIARLTPGATLAQADASVRSAMAALAARYPTTHQDKIGAVEPYAPLGVRMASDVTVGKMIVYGLAGLVLAVVCLNISGMMLVRSAMRERELAVRLAIGASRWRLMRYHLSEAFVLAVLGGGAASALLFGVPVVIAWWFQFYGPELDLFKPDIWIVLQCIALCFVASAILGMLPAIRFSRPAILAALKNDTPGSGRRVGRLQRLTAAAQAGLAVPFLVIGGVKLDQARVTLMADLGFTPQGVYAARLNLNSIGQTEEDRRQFVRDVEQNLTNAPGIESVSVADGVPLDFVYRNTRIALERESNYVQAHTTRIGPKYLETLDIQLLAGRTIDANDVAGAERVVLLSEPLSRQLFADNDALGKRVSFALEDDEPQTYTVVGVTSDLVSTQMGNPRPQLFISLAQHPSSSVLAIARGTPSDPGVRRAFESALTDADPDFVLGNLMTGEGLIQNSHEDLLTHSATGGVFAVIALILAAFGVYGVIAFMVTTRTREIGVRVALGASRLRVVKEVLGDALLLVVPGIGLGLVAAVFWVRVADPSWYSMGGVEPMIYSAAAATAFFVAVLAGIPSARRAAAVQPIIAIRAE